MKRSRKKSKLIASYPDKNISPFLFFFYCVFFFYSILFTRTHFCVCEKCGYLCCVCCLPGRKQRVSSLQSLVTWYRDHSASCPHEPQLRALEPKANLSTAAVWRCESDHSFVQYLYSPPKEVSDLEREERGNADSDGEAASKTEPPSAKGVAGRQRRKEGHKKCKGAS